MEDALKLLNIQKSECPDLWIRLPRHKWPTSWSNIEDPVVLLEQSLYGHPLAGLWRKHFEKCYCDKDGKNARKQGLFLSENVDDLKMAGGKQNFYLVHLGEPTSYLDFENLGMCPA